MTTDDDLIVTAEDFPATTVDLIGGKAAGIGSLVAAAVPVPPGFCLTTAAHRATWPAVESRLRAAVATLRAAGTRRFAVRSSHVAEDAAAAGAPGLYHSEVGLMSDDEILAAVRRVWASAEAPAAVEYQRRLGGAAQQSGMAVLIQAAPGAVVGGVIYTMLPGTADPSALLIEYAAGAPGNVIDNRILPHRLVVSKGCPHPDRPANLLTTEQVGRLVEWSLCVETRLDAPVDLEWLLDADGRLWMLQARQLPYPRVDPGGPYTAEAAGTTLRSDKLAPFRLRAVAEVQPADARLILPGAFAAYRACGGVVPPPVREACERVFQHYRDRGPVSIRSAYWSARDVGDMLPQSAMLDTTEDCLAHLEAYWRYLLDSGRVDYTTEVALLVGNWITPMASVIANAPGDHSAPVLLSALYGLLGGLETCTHDVYRVDPQNLMIVDSNTPHKQLAVFAPQRGPEPVPPQLRDRSVLSGDEVRAAARAAAAIAAKAGPVRIELLVRDGTESADRRIVTWQITPLSSTVDVRYFMVRVRGTVADQRDATEAMPVVSGVLTPLREPRDVEGLVALPDEAIVAIDFQRFELRDPELAATLAAALRDAARPVVLKGSLLSHFAALLREYSVTVYPVNDLPLAEVGTPIDVVPA